MIKIVVAGLAAFVFANASTAQAQQAQLPPVTLEEAGLHAQLGQVEFILGRRMQEILLLQQQVADLKAKLPVDPPKPAEKP